MFHNICQCSSYQKVLVAVLLSISYSSSVSAQITPDNTLGAESSKILSVDDLRNAIEGGAIRGNNLFHSFREFNVEEGSRIDFVNPDGIANIFSRVTGSNISEIFGTLGVEGSANLFLMNPNGIIFGKNAAIDVGGSFLATTAETIEFNNGNQFSAIASNKPLLTIDFPIGLGMGSDPGTIQVNGTGHNLGLNAAEPTFRLPAFFSLDVNLNQTLALIGGDIVLNGGVLNSPDGHIELGAVAAGNVYFEYKNLKNFNYEVLKLKNIDLFNESLIDVSGLTGGSIHSIGNRISINSGSGLFVQNQTKDVTQNIKIEAKSLEISGGGLRPVLIFEQGVIEIEPESEVIQAGFIDGKLLAPGTPVSEVLKEFSLSLDKVESAISFIPSFIFSESRQNAQGNNIQIDAEQLSILDGGQLISRSFERAYAGNINIESSNTVEVKGASGTPGFAELNFEIFSRINSDNFGSGAGGNINLSVNNVSTSNGGAITSVSNNLGRGGNVVINSSNIDSNGSVPNVFLPSSIGTAANNNGDAGDLTINAEKISLRNGANISTSTLASGKAGNINIKVTDSIEIAGIDNISQLPSAIISGGASIPSEFRKSFRLPPASTGNAGTVNISSSKIKVDNLGQINAANFGTGNAGNLNIKALEVALDNNAAITASTILGQGGNIILNTQDLKLANQSQITATAGGFGDGGNITINTDNLIGFNNSDITANAFQGNGGNIEINSDVILGIESRAKLTPNSDITASSDLGIDGTVNINSPEINADDEIVLAPIRQTNTPLEIFQNICAFSIANEGKLRIIDLSAEETPYNFLDRNDKYTLAIEQIEQGAKLNEVLTETNESSWQAGDPIVEPNAVRVNADGSQVLVTVASNRTEKISAPQVCSKQK